MIPIPLTKRIIFALDVETPEQARGWAEKLEPRVKFFKVGLQLFWPEASISSSGF